MAVYYELHDVEANECLKKNMGVTCYADVLNVPYSDNLVLVNYVKFVDGINEYLNQLEFDGSKPFDIVSEETIEYKTVFGGTTSNRFVKTILPYKNFTNYTHLLFTLQLMRLPNEYPVFWDDYIKWNSPDVDILKQIVILLNTVEKFGGHSILRYKSKPIGYKDFTQRIITRSFGKNTKTWIHDCFDVDKNFIKPKTKKEYIELCTS